ncbi:MAG: DUF3575 domain-containing protein [Bacteroidaceae bacterium]
MEKTYNHFLSIRKPIYMLLLGVLLGTITTTFVHAQRVAFKTNALYWATLSPNIGAELRLSQHFTVGMGLVGNVCKIGSYKPQFIGAEGEVRYWFSRPMARHFVGAMVALESHDMQLKNTNHYGDALAGGFTYGYAMPMGKRWNLEGSIGLGLVHLRDYKWSVGSLKPVSANNSKTTLAPMKASISIAYILK